MLLIRRILTDLRGTHRHANAGELVLPENSYYVEVRQNIWDQRRGEKKPCSQSADKVAKNIVHDVIRGKSGQIWRGGLATVCRTIPYLPKRIVEYAMHEFMGRGLSKIKPPAGKA